ncbi:MAG: hypothetical protein GX155_08300 [Smithella sp.]|jgi:hypothetical protein|nr:hypothetical protein [Smithella sp.]
MKKILIEHAGRYPQWEPADLYKLIYQAAMGPGHALTDEGPARDILLREIAKLGSGPDEPLIESISPDGRVVRVHLRPFTRRGLAQELLLQAFIVTGRTFRTSQEKLFEYAGQAAAAAREDKIFIEQERLSTFFSQIRESQFPSVRHSDEYRRLYRPAYRVVTAGLLPAEIVNSA